MKFLDHDCRGRKEREREEGTVTGAGITQKKKRGEREGGEREKRRETRPLHHRGPKFSRAQSLVTFEQGGRPRKKRRV